MGVNAGGLLIRAALVAATLWVGERRVLGQEAAPAAETGTISGVVLDRSNGDVIIEAGVEVVGQRKTVRTNVNGKYAIKLPPGKYELRFYAPYYKGVRLPDVVVKAGQVSRADAALESSGAAGIQVVEVVAPAKKAAEVAQIAKRKEAAVVSDTISRESMAKSTGSEASAIVKRAPAVTVRNDKFVFVRGLSERYTSALLNGNTLPSPDPFRRAVPLDLFPADFLDSIGVVKTFSPELPGDFTGGLIELDLRDLPDQLTYSLGVSMGANTNTTFQDFLTYRGAPLDYLASGTRARESATLPPVDLNELPVPQQYAIARTFPNVWSPETSTAPPNFGANFSIGNRYGPFGFQIGALLSNEWTTLPNLITRQLLPAGQGKVTVTDNLLGASGLFQSKLGGVLTAAYEPTERHRFTFRSFVYQNALDTTLLQQGTLDTRFAVQSQLQYIVDSLAYGQLGGEDKFTDWLLADWRTALARTRRDEPDTRLVLYLGGPPPRFATSADGNGGRRYSASTVEQLSDTRVDFTIPFQTKLPWTDVWDGLPAKFKFGPAYSYRARDFALRQFDYFPNSDSLDVTEPPDILLAPSNMIPGIIGFNESTDIQDAYTGSQQIIAGYGLLELPIIRDRLRVVGGAKSRVRKLYAG